MAVRQAIGKSTGKGKVQRKKVVAKASPKRRATDKPEPQRFTLAHVTHEAVEQIGGIGTVLEGLMISPVYQKHIRRSILIGPMAAQPGADPQSRLGEHGTVLYSSIDNIDTLGLGNKLHPIEWAFNVAIVYGKRKFDQPSQHRKGEAEVILIDVFRANPDRLNVFKLRLWETFGLDSGRYERAWDYEEYVRLAEPAYYTLNALLHREDRPCVLFSHEFMGMPAALKAIMDGQEDFRTIFHAHECATARRIVEDHPGHDTMFYNVLDEARKQGKHLDDVFGNHDHALRHALVSRSHLCDGIIAVGDRTRDEMKFLSERFDDKPIDIVYNGLPVMKLNLKSKLAARGMLLSFAKAQLGYEPDVLMTHVTRPVISKGLWRDLRVCHELDGRLASQGKTGVLIILTTAGGTKRPQDVANMVKNYGWPRHHREGYPDLVGPCIGIHNDIVAFNANHRAIQIILVNQFGWSRKLVGPTVPESMDFAALRAATDVEFGMAVYEPFGISPLEPLGCGAICVISNVCGCEGFVHHVTNNGGTKNVISADFTQAGDRAGLDDMLLIGHTERDAIESRVAAEVADQLIDRMPWTDKQREVMLKSGQALVAKMGWDQVMDNGLLGLLRRIC